MRAYQIRTICVFISLSTYNGRNWKSGGTEAELRFLRRYAVTIWNYSGFFFIKLGTSGVKPRRDCVRFSE